MRSALRAHRAGHVVGAALVGTWNVLASFMTSMHQAGMRVSRHADPNVYVSQALESGSNSDGAGDADASNAGAGARQRSMIGMQSGGSDMPTPTGSPSPFRPREVDDQSGGLNGEFGVIGSRGSEKVRVPGGSGRGRG